MKTKESEKVDIEIYTNKPLEECIKILKDNITPYGGYPDFFNKEKVLMDSAGLNILKGKTGRYFIVDIRGNKFFLRVYYTLWGLASGISPTFRGEFIPTKEGTKIQGRFKRPFTEIIVWLWIFILTLIFMINMVFYDASIDYLLIPTSFIVLFFLAKEYAKRYKETIKSFLLRIFSEK